MTDGVQHVGVQHVGAQRAGWRLTVWRSVARQCAAGVVVAAVVPLCLSQVPFGGFPGLVGSGTAARGTAADLVLPFLVAATPLAGLAVRRSGAWAVMVGGLVLIVGGDGLAGLDAGLGAGHPAGSAALAVSASVLRGSGAGLALPATAALAFAPVARTGQAPASGHVDRTGPARRPLPAWWAAVTVASLAVLPGLARTWAGTDGWRAAFGPVPLLTAVGFAAAAACKPLAGQARDRARDRAGNRAGNRTAWRARNRAAFPPAQRAKLAVLAPPAAALALLAVGVGGRPGREVAAIAVCEAAGLFVLAAMASRGCAGNGYTMACAVAGFVVAPASAELLSLRAMAAGGGTGSPDTLLVAGVIAGAALGAGAALASAAALTTGGLLLAAAALVVACFAGPFAVTAALGLLAAAVAGGLTATLARPAGETTAAGAMVGAVLLVSGMLVGSLTAAAIRMQLASGPVRGLGPAALGTPAGGPGAAAVPPGLVTASGWWLLAGAAVTVAVALGRCASRARTAAASDRAETAGAPPAGTEAAPPAGTAAAPPAGTGAATRAARHVARGDRRGGKVRPVSG